jgi:hypothetical protein
MTPTFTRQDQAELTRLLAKFIEFAEHKKQAVIKTDKWLEINEDIKLAHDVVQALWNWSLNDEKETK